jgi:hypothetical protein
VSPALEQATVNGIPQGWWPGNKWPPADCAGLWQNAAPTHFPRNYWTFLHYSITVLGDFVKASASGVQWDTIALPPYPTGAALAAEIDELVALVEYRPGVMTEALAQRSNLIAYWRGVLMFDAGSAPRTCDLVEIASRVGQFQAMHYKRKFHRPRPSQISPSLLPPINPPGHPAYPSGHSTEAHLMAYCLAEVMPQAARTPATPPPNSTAPPPGPDSTPLLRMAQRIARNREVLGLHYPSDSACGKKLAEESFKILMQCQSVRDIIHEAKQEWWP